MLGRQEKQAFRTLIGSSWSKSDTFFNKWQHVKRNQNTVEIVTRLLFPHVKYISENVEYFNCTKDEYLYRIGISRRDVHF